MTNYYTPKQAQKAGLPVAGPSYAAYGRMNEQSFTVTDDHGHVIGKVWKLTVARNDVWSYHTDLYFEDAPHIEWCVQTRDLAVAILQRQAAGG